MRNYGPIKIQAVPRWTRVFGQPDQLPDMERLIVYSLTGLTRGALDAVLRGGSNIGEHIWDVGPSQGHLADSIKPAKTLFPESWSPQDCADALCATCSSPEFFLKGKPRPHVDEYRSLHKWINDVLIKVEYSLVSSAKARNPSGFPIEGTGVRMTVRFGDELIRADLEETAYPPVHTHMVKVKTLKTRWTQVTS